MNLTRFAMAHLRAAPLTTALNIALLTLGTASIVALMLIAQQMTQTLTRNAENIDLVLGAKGSPVQLVLSSVYHADIPTGNIPMEEALRWAEDRRVAEAVPIALGDSVRGFRIVGTQPKYLDFYNAEIADGRVWNKSLEAIIGAQVAKATGLKVGDQFSGAHGLSGMGDSHDETPYTVTGILAASGSVLDRLVVTSLESVWEVHGEGHHNHGDDVHHDDHAEDKHDAAHHDAHDDHAEDKHDEAHHDEHDDHAEDKHDEAHHDEHDDHAEDKHDEAHHDEHDDHADEKHDDAHHDEHDDHAEDKHDKAHHDEHDGHAEDKHDEDKHDESHHDEHDGHAEEHRDITAMLIRYRSPLAATSLPRQINQDSDLQAAAPAYELARLLSLIGVGLDALRVFALILVVSAGLSIFAALYSALNQRRGDLAMMRCLGATRGDLMAALLIEGLLLAAAGVVVGLLLGHGVVELLGQALEDSRGVSMTGLTFLVEEIWLIAGALAVGLLSAALPAWQAYRTDVSRTIAQS